MNTLICFDTDGTLLTEEMIDGGQYVMGVIPTDILSSLEQRGFSICIVSPSPYYPKYENGSPIFRMSNREASGTYRHANLLSAVEQVSALGITPERKIYVSDNGDKNEADKAGFEFMTPQDFLIKYKGDKL